MRNNVIITHALPNASDSLVSALASTCVDSTDALIILHDIACEARLAALGVIAGMKLVDKEACVCEVSSFADKRIRCKLTGKVVNNNFRCLWETGVDSGEDVVTPFSDGNCVETKADGMRAPKDEYAACKPIPRVGLEELIAISHLLSLGVSRCVVVL